MYILETHAKNEKEALAMGSQFLEVNEDLISVEMVKKGGGGFLGLGSKSPSVYMICTLEDNKTPIEVIIKGLLSTTLHHMGYQAKFLQFETLEDGKMYVEIASPQASNIIGKKGKTLEALQFITNVMLEKYSRDTPKILLDIEKYRKKRQDFLARLARNSASQVKKNKKSKLLLPLNPYERRLIHMELQEMNDIETESEGYGVYKKIRIKFTGKIENKKPNKNNKKNSRDEQQEHDLSSAQQEFAGVEHTSDDIPPQEHDEGVIPQEHEEEVMPQEHDEGVMPQEHVEVEETATTSNADVPTT